MCSDGLAKIKLYDKSFQQFAPMVDLVYPNEEYQQKVTLGICNAKNKIRFETDNPENPQKVFTKVCQYLVNEKKVNCIVAGCTDIRNVFRPNYTNVTYIDSLEVLAKSIINN